MCREREMACDEAVVQATERPRDYAACLTSLAERRLERRLELRGETLSLGAWHRRPELVERVQRILKRGPGLNPAAARGLLALMGCGLVLGSVEFAQCPQLVTFAAQPAATADYAADRAMLSGYKMVDALAPMPTRAELAAMRGPSPAGGVHAAEKSRKAAGRMLSTARRGAERVASPASQAAALAQPEAMNHTAMAEQTATTHVQQVQWTPAGQLVVFTAWEQIEEPAGTADEAQPAANGSPAQSVAAPQFAVTQLILRVYPNPYPRQPQAGGCGSERACAANPGSDRTDSRPNSSMTPMQQVLPLRDGWLVFQL
jgi:hypothetical protein